MSLHPNFAFEEIEELLLEDEEVVSSDVAFIVVYNDDVNTFDWVIESFIEILGHTEVQAEQLSLIVHFKGKATVKTGSYNDLRPKKDALIDRGISAVIEQDK